MENRFDKDAANWDAKSHRVRLAGDVSAAIRQEVVLHADMKVLDYGCGTGLVSLPMAGEVSSLTGIDSSSGMLEVFSQKALELGYRNVLGLLIDLENGDTLSERYDLILSSMTFHHIRDIQMVIARLFDVLNPGGAFCLADLDPDDGLFHSDPSGVHHQGFKREEMISHFRSAGFQNIRVKTAAIMRRPGTDGIEREFTIFLITGYRPELS